MTAEDIVSAVEDRRAVVLEELPPLEQRVAALREELFVLDRVLAAAQAPKSRSVHSYRNDERSSSKTSRQLAFMRTFVDEVDEWPTVSTVLAMLPDELAPKSETAAQRRSALRCAIRRRGHEMNLALGEGDLVVDADSLEPDDSDASRENGEASGS